MSKLRQTLFKSAILVCCLLGSVAYGQKQTKTYNETFKVNPETVLDINTSYTDIEFETWDKNEVVVEAVIELEGASEEEAQKFFERNEIEIKGNSREIEITSRSGNSWMTFAGLGEDFEIEIPDIEPFLMEIEIPELAPMPELADLPPMPPLPPMNFKNFDYEAYEKDGEKYMKKWQKEFNEQFDEEYEKKMEAWGKEMEKRVKERTERMKERSEDMERRMEEREARMKERQKSMEKAREARMKAVEARRADLLEARKAARDRESSSFYIKADGQSKNFKVKKKIKIKMPKSVKLNLNVRHGEVKLAGLSKDVKASLTYSSLLASSIDGKDTFIKASYSPVQVEHWILGKLDSQYSDHVILNDVTDLLLTTTSSDIVIDRVLKKANIENKLGTLHIRELGNAFNSVNVTVANGEVYCKLPNTAFEITVDSNNSKFAPPADIAWAKAKNNASTVYSAKKGSGSPAGKIKISSVLSEVVLQQ